MKTTKMIFILLFFFISSVNSVFSQCEINASVFPTQLYCGQSATLTAFGIGDGVAIMTENFNSGFGTGWSSTPGAVSFSNPCSPAGVDGTPHAWMGSTTSVPRTLVSAPYDITAATAGVTICFDLKYAIQSEPAPCEGPDEPHEGVYIQYSTNGGATWTTIHYFDPNGGFDSQLTNWNNWCFQIPAAAITANTQFRWHQTADSGPQFDHWGIDNVQIFQNDILAEVVWGHDGYSYGVGSSGGSNPNLVTPTQTTTYPVTITTGTGAVCSTSVQVTVIDPVYQVDLDVDTTSVCINDCATITGFAAQVLDTGGMHTFSNSEYAALLGIPTLADLASMFCLVPFVGCPCPDGSTVSIGQSCPGQAVFTGTIAMNINVTDLNAVNVSDGQLTNICINTSALLTGNFSAFEIRLKCPDGNSILLANTGDLTGNVLSNMCFNMSATSPVSSGTTPYSGSWLPVEPFSNLDGCNMNGVWTVEFIATYDWSSGVPSSMPAGGLSGWTIEFDDPPLHGPVTSTWAPVTGLSDPNNINTSACPTVTTEYILTVSNGVAGCLTHQDTVLINVSSCNGCVVPAMVIDPLAICSSSSVDLSNAINPTSEPAVLSYHSTQSDAQNDSSPLTNTSVNLPGIYWLRAENPSADTCFVLHQIIVTVDSIVVPVINGQLWYCAGDSVTLSTTPATYSTYSWNVGGNQPTLNTISSQQITVTVTDLNGCSATSLPVDLIHPPVAILTATPSSGIAPLSVNFSNTSTGASNYDWYLIGIDTFSTTNLSGHSIIYDSVGSYTTMLVAHSSNCSDTAYVVVNVIESQPLDFEVPNVFTPNGDGVNDFFSLGATNVKELEITIVNRWGNLIYQSDNVNFQWDGKDMKGQLVTEGVYFYNYKVTGMLGDELTGHGFVTLER